MRSIVRGLRRTLTLTAAAGLLLVGTAAPSSAQVVFTVERCGETVSGNMRLTEDLDCRVLANWFDEDGDESYGAYDLKPYALRVEGSGTIDLNGWTVITGPILDVDYEYDAGQDRNEIDGYLLTWSGEAVTTYDPDGGDDDELDFYPSIGILVEDSANVTVRNGVVRGARGEIAADFFVDGGGWTGNQVLVVNSRDVTLQDLAVSENANIMGTGPGVMTDLSDVDNAFDGSGVAIVASDRVTIDRVDSFRNDGSGLTIYASRDIGVSESSFNDNDDRGILIAGGSDYTFEDRTADNFTWTGFRASRNIDLTDVETISNGMSGIRMVYNLVWDCDVLDSGNDYCDDEELARQVARNGGGTWTNVTSMSNDADGIDLTGVDGITIQDSYLVNNGSSGIELELTENIIVQRSTMEGNEDDGIDASYDHFDSRFDLWWDEVGLFGLGSAGKVETEGDDRVAPASHLPWQRGYRAPGPGLRFLNNVVIDNGDDGGDLYEVRDATVVGNRFERNGSDGLELDYVRSTPVDGRNVISTVISDNQFIDNGDDGLYSDDSRDIALLRNVSTGNGSAGFDLSDDDDRWLIERNRAEDNGDNGFEFDETDDARVIRNVAVGNGGNGFFIEDSSDGLFDRNEARENGANGFKVYDDGDLVEATTFRRNTSSFNGDDGFNFERADSLSVIGNRATRNGRNGFWMEDYDAELPGFVVYRGNRADRNGDWGHVSTGDVVDNQRRFSTVRNNGGRRNDLGTCLNVRCGRRLVTGFYGIP